MQKGLKINVWGVRGSFPVPDARFLTYGGNTTCISVECGERLLIFDAGSGLVRLGESLSKKSVKRVDILLSHFHIDHIMGLIRFPLLYDREGEIHLYGEAGEIEGILERLNRLAGPPLWPVSLQNCPAHIEIHEIGPGQHISLSRDENGSEAVQIHTLRGNHPGRSLLYRLETERTSMVYALDCEMDEEMFRSLADFSRGSDLIIWDANFTEKDLKLHRGWGHSSWEEGIALCREAGIKRALMTHYAPEYTDEYLKQEEKRAKGNSFLP